MKLQLAVVMLCFSAGALAQNSNLSTGLAHQGDKGAVVIDLPPEVFTQNQNNRQPSCQRCCIYENRNYTEGAVLKADGVLLQCARDEKSLGTNNLIWRIVK